MIITPDLSYESVAFNSQVTSSNVNNVTDPLYTYIDSIKNRSITTTKTAAYTIQQNEDYVVPVSASSNFTITLPAGATQTSSITILRTDDNLEYDVTLLAVGSDNIANNVGSGTATSIILRAQERLTLMFSGNTWLITDRFFNPDVHAYFDRAGLVAQNFSQLSSITPNWNVLSDPYGMYNVVARNFTIPTDGVYSFNAVCSFGKVSVAAADNPVYIQFQRSGATNLIAFTDTRTTTQPIGYRVTATGIAKLNRGDVILFSAGDGGFAAQTMSLLADSFSTFRIQLIQ